MVEYERIDILDDIDISKTNKSKECMPCHYWYFLGKNFSYGPYRTMQNLFSIHE